MADYDPEAFESIYDPPFTQCGESSNGYGCLLELKMVQRAFNKQWTSYSILDVDGRV